MPASNFAMQNCEILLFWVSYPDNIENLAKLQNNSVILAKYVFTLI